MTVNEEAEAKIRFVIAANDNATVIINRVPKLGYRAAYLKQLMRDKLIEHRQYINRYGEDMPEIREWKWPQGATFRSV